MRPKVLSKQVQDKVWDLVMKNEYTQSFERCEIHYLKNKNKN